ncbi:NAD(P)H-dependent flavin oxidoreductase [Chitinasiproducens palmae]|uniref:Nitronate monooxygenase n=1 Tax=Chitinasiproducens palmae TaxID=1770053 RepID=A0A1H2PNW0_9BURK|nr:nitronate monooxygenase family protein [Chitinasiproducens palmae]SDV48391.1 nitronate monooxygenase [Chitinasiproducens palmae]
MSLLTVFDSLVLPVIASPMFIVSGPKLVLAQCRAGIVGSMPALNARPQAQLRDWLAELIESLAEAQRAHPDAPPAPFAINQIVHASNARLEADIKTCVDCRVPIWITSLQAPPRELIDAVHAYGGVVMHDVVNLRHAEKALAAGVDGLIAVAAGAGGHAGRLSPFALIGEIRRIFSGPLALSGAIASGDAILAAQAMGADLAYIGTRFIASAEATASDAYRHGLVDASAADIVYTDAITGVHGNYLRASLLANGLDPEALPAGAGRLLLEGKDAKAWRDIWGAGQGVGLIDDAPAVADIVQRLRREYDAARRRLLGA